MIQFPDILDELQNEDLGIAELYEQVMDRFEDINEFILSLDALYVLNCIVYSKEYGVLKYVKRN